MIYWKIGLQINKVHEKNVYTVYRLDIIQWISDCLLEDCVLYCILYIKNYLEFFFSNKIYLKRIESQLH